MQPLPMTEYSTDNAIPPPPPAKLSAPRLIQRKQSKTMQSTRIELSPKETIPPPPPLEAPGAPTPLRRKVPKLSDDDIQVLAIPDLKCVQRRPLANRTNSKVMDLTSRIHPTSVAEESEKLSLMARTA